MTSLEFRCTSCKHVIEIDAAMREAIRAAGCPVCGGSVAAADFGPR